jgi:hypothetical protein
MLMIKGQMYEPQALAEGESEREREIEIER